MDQNEAFLDASYRVLFTLQRLQASPPPDQTPEQRQAAEAAIEDVMSTIIEMEKEKL